MKPGVAVQSLASATRQKVPIHPVYLRARSGRLGRILNKGARFAFIYPDLIPHAGIPL